MATPQSKVTQSASGQPSPLQSALDTAKNDLVGIGQVLVESYTASKLIAPYNPTLAALIPVINTGVKIMLAGGMTPQQLANLETTTEQQAKSSSAKFEKILANSPTKKP